MKIIIGLGNPGVQYLHTRHNIGWIALDMLAAKVRTEFKPGKGDYYEAPFRWRGHEAVLIKPTTFMNNSGLAAKQLLIRHKAEPADILVIADELQFPLGRVQLKPGGSSGGHNGLESLIYELGTDQYPRIRCGIGNDFERGKMVEYVLAPFPAEHKERVVDMATEAAEMALLWVTEGTPKAMSFSNRVKKPAPDAPSAAKPSSSQPENDK